MKYLVNVTQPECNSGCFAGSFDSLDEVRDFAKARAASFKESRLFGNRPVKVLVVKNGTNESKEFIL